MSKIINFELSSGEIGSYKSFSIERPPGHIGRYDDNNFDGLVMSKRVDPIICNDNKFNGLLSNLYNNNFVASSLSAVDGLKKSMCRAQSLGDSFSLDIPVALPVLEVNKVEGPTVYYSPPTITEYTANIIPIDAQANQVMSVFSPESVAVRRSRRNAMGTVLGVDPEVLNPVELIGQAYNPRSMSNILFGGAELRAGADRKSVLKEFVRQSAVKTIITFQPSEIITLAGKDVQTVILISTLDNPCASVFQNHYAPIFRSCFPDKSCGLVCFDCKMDVLVGMSIEALNTALGTTLCSSFVDGDKGFLFSKDMLCVINFYPNMVKFASLFAYSFGFYVSLEAALTYTPFKAPPKLPDMELDRFNITYNLIKTFPEVLKKDNASFFDKDRMCVVSFSEHMAYPDMVVDEVNTTTPGNIISVYLRSLSSKVLATSRLKVYIGAPSIVSDVVTRPTFLNVTDFFDVCADVVFVPSISYEFGEFSKGVMVEYSTPYSYPVTTIYYYYLTDVGTKVFLDFVDSKLTFMERRMMMIRNGLPVIALSNSPNWDYSLVIELNKIYLYYDMFVIRSVLLNPLRKLARRRFLAKEPYKKIIGYSIGPDGAFVVDPTGYVIVGSGSYVNVTTYDGGEKTFSGNVQRDLSFAVVDEACRITITKQRNDSYPKVDLGFFLSVMIDNGLSEEDVASLHEFGKYA